MPRRLTPPPSFIRPQLAELIDQAPAADQWIHEIKIDGYSIGARNASGRAKMLTRKVLDWTKRFGPAAEALARQPIENAYWAARSPTSARTTSRALLASYRWPPLRSSCWGLLSDTARKIK
jgi:hypothetical protein